MECDFSTPNRRTLLAGMLGTAGLVAAGCDNPTVGEDAPSRTQPATSTPQPSTMRQSSASTTPTRPNPHRPTPTETADASMIIKCATVPVCAATSYANGGAATASTTGRL